MATAPPSAAVSGQGADTMPLNNVWYAPPARRARPLAWARATAASAGRLTPSHRRHARSHHHRPRLPTTEPLCSVPVVRRHAFSCEERPPGDGGVEQPLLALGVFATAQPFVELLTFLYDGAHELGASGPLRLFVFKRGCLPDTSAHSVASRGSRLEIDLCQLCTSNSSMTLHDATAALLTLAVSATWTHEAHVTGVELRFTGAGVASAFLWYDAAMATDATRCAAARGGRASTTQTTPCAPFLPEPRRAQPGCAYPQPWLEVLRKRRAGVSKPGGLGGEPPRRRSAGRPAPRAATPPLPNGLREEMRRTGGGCQPAAAGAEPRRHARGGRATAATRRRRAGAPSCAAAQSRNTVIGAGLRVPDISTLQTRAPACVAAEAAGKETAASDSARSPGIIDRRRRPSPIAGGSTSPTTTRAASASQPSPLLAQRRAAAAAVAADGCRPLGRQAAAAAAPAEAEEVAG